MNRKLPLVVVAGLVACLSPGCSRHSGSPVVIDSCLAAYRSSGLTHTTVLKLRNISDNFIVAVQVSVGPSDVDLHVRIPPGSTRVYSVSNVMPLSRTPACDVWHVAFAGSRSPIDESGAWRIA